MRRSLFVALVLVALLGAAGRWLPDDPRAFGILTLLPSLFLVFYIFWTKRILEALTLAALLGFVMVHKGDFFGAFNEALQAVLMSEDIAWLFLVCGLMGSIIALVERAGGSVAFGRWVSRRARTRQSTLLWTWLLGMSIFIDDYLNSLTVGSCMAPITDRHKVSREMLAYVVDSTAAPVCVLIPVSTWAVFVARLLESNGLAPEGEGILYFIRTIPFNFYGWFAAILVPLVIVGIVPLIGPLQEAEKRARETGVLAPAGSDKIDIKAGESIEVPNDPRVAHFFVPMLFLVASTIYFDIDLMMGVVSTMAFMFLLYVPAGLMSAEDYADLTIRGVKNMLYPLILVVLAFTFATANEQIGFTGYVIDSAAPVMWAGLMPLIVFLVLGVTEFITGTNWGMYVIALPIVIPLAEAVGANQIVVVAAVLSAGVWGSHICFYSDATILSSASTGCDNYRHAITQMPFGFLAAGLAGIAFLIAGFVF